MEGKGRYIVLASVAIAAAIITFFCGRLVGTKEGIVQCQVEAIKANHAKYVIMDEFGHTEFHWLEKGDVDLKAEAKGEAKPEVKKP